jgi:diguanylate cyclase (GGDEF)-like protein
MTNPTDPGRLRSTAPLRIVIVESEPGEARRVEAALASMTTALFHARRARDLAGALEALDEGPWDAVVTSLSLPDAAPLDTLTRLQQRAPHVPIVVVESDRTDDDVESEVIAAGAHAVLIHGEYSGRALVRTVRQAIERARMFEELHAAREAARHLATHDPLTGIANRLLLDDRLEHAVANARRSGETIAVLMLDLDRFKTINDQFGHATGDEVLRCVAQRLAKQVRQSDTIARLGGDEFALVLTHLQRETDAARVARKLLDSLSQPIAISAERFQTGASIGIATHPRDGRDAGELLRSADLAMYDAKRSGGLRYQFHSAEMNTSALERMQIEGRLALGLARGEFALLFQPQVDLASRRIVGVEALLRWNDPLTGLRPPAAFLAVAEETGQIAAIGEWVLRTACREARRWSDAATGPFHIGVNVSARQIRQLGFEKIVAAALSESGLAPHQLTLEISESALIDDAGTSLRSLVALADQGVRLSLDDFGKGRLALADLKRIRVHELKIDGAFVAGLPADPTDATITAAILTLARGLGAAVVAEGIETHDQLVFLEEAGCARGQGFLFGAPVPRDSFDALLNVPALEPWLEKPR